MFRVFLITLTLFLTGCAGLNMNTSEPLPSENTPWDKRQQQLLGLESWQLKGKIGIRSQQGNDSANLYWQQQQKKYAIELTGPLGQGGARIEGNGDGIMIDVAGEPPLWSPSPEQLMEQTLGWQFPVRELLYWVKGVPAPGQPFELTLEQQEARKIIQKGWEINYLRYTNLDNIRLPGKLTIARSDLKITIIAKEWLTRH